MLKQYIRYQIRKWLPLLLVFVLYATFSTLISGLSLGVARYYGTPNASTYTGEQIVIAMLLPSFSSLFILPFFVYSYRTSKKAVDTFYQAAYADKTIRRTRILIGLGIVLATITVSFWLGTALYGLRYAATPAEQAITSTGSSASTTYILRNYVNFAYMPLAYLVGVLLFSGQYFINCYLVSLGNHLIDQICTVLFGNFILAGIVVMPTLYALSLTWTQLNSDFFRPFFYYGLGPVTPILFLAILVNPLVVGEGPNGLLDGSVPHLAIAISLYVVFAAVLGVLVMKEKDPSGEYAGKAGPRNKAIAFIPHVAGLLTGIAFSCTGLLGIGRVLVIPIFLFAIFGVFYYIALSLWRRNFKLNKLDWICFASVVGFCLVLTVIEMVMSMLRSPLNY